tara:strand:+ start:181 stop:396 length:216 start_codon:yes stop_codon:yes gene_type:complete
MSNDDNKNGQLNELKAELIDSQDALQNLVFQKSMQQLEDLSQIKKTRKKIARLKTLIHENKTLDNSVGVKK